MDTPVRVVLGTFGFDQHEVGARIVARFLREAGCEVIYVGRFNLPAHFLATAGLPARHCAIRWMCSVSEVILTSDSSRRSTSSWSGIRNWLTPTWTRLPS